MSVKVPNHALTEAYSYAVGNQDTRTLPQNAYVCPIDPYYLPRHLKESSEYAFFNAETHVYCYTRYGLIPIPKNIVRVR